MNEFIAHKRDDGKVQTVRAHLEGTAKLARSFADTFNAGDQGELVGLLHDIGKYSAEFQNRIKSNGPKVDHATAGAFECAKNKQNYAAFCIASHHTGLQDKFSLKERLGKALNDQIPNYKNWKKEIKFPEVNTTIPQNDGNVLSEIFFIRMLFSCLVDADYLDTELFINNGYAYRDSGEELETISKSLDIYIKTKLKQKNKLDTVRSQLLNECIKNAEKAPGLFTLTVPTGGGKTIASLAFALKHAIKNNQNRVIFVVPYTSIIEQTASVFRQILGEDNVLEHHSNIEFESEDRSSSKSVQMSLATENWDKPIIVTTAVQFFESLFANKSSKCRKLHNIARSVIIFDEAQMLPRKYLDSCVYSISQLVRYYGASAVLCTATQPVLDSLFKKYFPEITAQELCPLKIREEPIFNRNTIIHKGKMTWDEIALHMNQKQQILCIVNSRKAARELFKQLEENGRYHLSTLMCPVHRKQVLEMIRRNLKEGKICRVVSTSLIEAGVDLDFPEVIREEAGFDSVLQAAGRCNREGSKDRKESIVSIFKPESSPPQIFTKNIQASKDIWKQLPDINYEQAIKLYFNELLFREVNEPDEVLKLSNCQSFPFNKIADKFKLIDNKTVTIYIALDEDTKNLLNNFDTIKVDKSLMRHLNKYSVSVFQYHFTSLNERGYILTASDNNSIYYISDLSIYDSECGLSLNVPEGKADFI